VVVALYVSVVGIGNTTIDTAELAFRVDGSRAVGSTHPSFEGEMQRFLVPLPVMFRPERLCAESTLESFEWCTQLSPAILGLGWGCPSPSSSTLASGVEGGRTK
jgi:hypothetical protein